MTARVLLFAMPGNERFASRMAGLLAAELGYLSVHRFPDEESLVRFHASPDGRDVLLVSTLDRPDGKFLPLIVAARTAIELGARRVGLVAPYLAYMRQDERFAPGEAVSARIVLAELSSAFSWFVTVDPHLHRIRRLEDVLTIPCRAVVAAPAVAKWIGGHVERPIVIGPDSESGQWAREVARLAEAPFTVWRKARTGDASVRISPDGEAGVPRDRTPVIVDDIISTANTMAGAIRAVRALSGRDPVCVGIHAVFAPGAEHLLRAENCAQIVTTNSIVHPTNAIDIAPDVAVALRGLLG